MQPIDWDDAFDNRGYIANWTEVPPRLAAAAEAFREARMHAGEAVLGLPYGAHVRERVDLFRPHGQTRGLVVFVHGGYWRSFDRTDFSHLAAGALGRGWAVAVPGYVLCPEGTVPAISRQVARAVEHVAALVGGPIRLVGHSAGGQVVTRLVAEHSPLVPGLLRRVARVVSISGVHDLLPLMLAASINDDLRLGEAVAREESPARLDRETEARLVVEPARHHFDVIDALGQGGPLLDEVLDDG